jgi:hypothetical protein
MQRPVAPVPVRLGASRAPSQAMQRELHVREHRTSAARLAAATRGTIAREPFGFSTVAFAPDEEPPHSGPSPASATTLLTPAPAVTLGRTPDDAALSEAAPSPPAATVPPAPPATPAAGDEMDEIYDEVIRRLRHDLLREREQMGDLLGDLY